MALRDKEEIRNWVIYKITNPNGRVYVGITTNFKKRMSHYNKFDCVHQVALRKSLVKYGFSAHNIEVIEEFSSNTSYAYGKEIFWIRTNMSCAAKFPEMGGLNMTNGGVGSHGVIMSDATKEKLRQANLGKKYSAETKAKLSIMRKGKKINRVFTEEDKLKMRELKLNFKHTDEAKKKISEAGRGNKYRCGKVLSESHKQSIIDSNKGNTYMLGRKHSDETRRLMSENSGRRK
jgi:group I intron endonuclease